MDVPFSRLTIELSRGAVGIGLDPVRVPMTLEPDGFRADGFNNTQGSLFRSSLSAVMIWDAFATESSGNPLLLDGSSTFPGASAHARLLVRGTHTTALIVLLLKPSL